MNITKPVPEMFVLFLPEVSEYRPRTVDDSAEGLSPCFEPTYERARHVRFPSLAKQQPRLHFPARQISLRLVSKGFRSLVRDGPYSSRSSL